MRTTAIRGMAAGILTAACFILISCSGSNAPLEGSPAYYWAAAKETFATKDYVKTVEHLEKITATENEYTARARPWLLVMTSGMSAGYMYLADSFEAGARANKANPTGFRKQVNTYRREASQLALEFVQVFDQFQKAKDDPVPITMPFPTGNAAPPTQLNRASAGIMLAQQELEPVEKQTVARGVLLTSCDTAGAPNDLAKTEELLKPGTLTVPRAAFMTAMANTLFAESELYGSRKLDDRDKQKIFCNRALDALKTIPETKQTKELTTKINKALKAT